MTKEFLDSIKESAWSHIAGLLANEMAPFTQNGHYYQETKSKYLARYKDIKLGKLNIPQKPVHKRLKMTSGGVPDGSGEYIARGIPKPDDNRSHHLYD